MPIIPTLAQLQQEFGLRNVSIVNAKTVAGYAANKYLSGVASSLQIKHDSNSNPYLDKITPGSAHDPDNNNNLVPYYNPLGNSIGNPVYTSVTFLSGSYQDAQNKTVSFPQIDLESVLVSVSFPRKIVKTEIQGRSGTVKEYIGEDDAHITIQGIICGSNGVYPYNAVQDLMKVINAPVSIDVASEYLNTLGITTLVFDSRQLNQDAGGYSYQKFTLNAISDTPQEILITG